MGEIADMMLDGTLCEGCGVFIATEPPGYPCYCSAQCKADRTPTMPAKPLPIAKVKCPVCKKKVKHNGLADHMRDAHGEKAVPKTKPQGNPPYVRSCYNDWKNP